MEICAFDKGRFCSALKEKQCEWCRFRKTKEQLREEHARTRERIGQIYGTTLESFLDLKGYGYMKNLFEGSKG